MIKKLTEYAVIVAVLVAIALAAYQAIGNAIIKKNNGTATKIRTANLVLK